jgi:hypothetical protein
MLPVFDFKEFSSMEFWRINALENTKGAMVELCQCQLPTINEEQLPCHIFIPFFSSPTFSSRAFLFDVHWTTCGPISQQS